MLSFKNSKYSSSSGRGVKLFVRIFPTLFSVFLAFLLFFDFSTHK